MAYHASLKYVVDVDDVVQITQGEFKNKKFRICGVVKGGVEAVNISTGSGLVHTIPDGSYRPVPRPGNFTCVQDDLAAASAKLFNAAKACQPIDKDLWQRICAIDDDVEALLAALRAEQNTEKPVIYGPDRKEYHPPIQISDGVRWKLVEEPLREWVAVVGVPTLLSDKAHTLHDAAKTALGLRSES